MASLFSKIANKEIPAYIVAETTEYLAFLDMSPIAKGHVLCIPKKEVDYIFDLSNEEYAGLMLFAKSIAIGLKKAVECKKIGIAVIGLEVPHAHVHLIPMNGIQDMSFINPRLSFTVDEYILLTTQIKRAISL